MGFLGGSVVKNLPANARSVGSVPELGRSPRSSSWTEESGGLQSMGSQRDTTDQLNNNIHFIDLLELHD